MTMIQHTTLCLLLTASLAAVGSAAERPVFEAPPPVRVAVHVPTQPPQPPQPPPIPPYASPGSNPTPPPVFVESIPKRFSTDDGCRECSPRCVRRPTTPSNTPRYCGYYVGGGLPVHGEGRHIDRDGTWGWDYGGLLQLKRISLNWSHGQRTQGGTGAYKSDGPKLRHE